MTTGIVYVAVPAAALDRLAKLAGDADVILNHLPALHDPEQTQTLIHVRDVIRHELTWTRPHDEDAERIVCDLGNGLAPCDIVEDAPSRCLLCDTDDDHAESCPWRRAREWVEAHPVGEQG